MLLEISSQLFESLLNSKNSVVFCESCTAGLAAATLGRFPGASKVLTGSMVVYQTTTKHDWLQLDNAILDSPEIGPVSDQVTRLLSQHVLQRSSTATLAAAITGHLGPSESIAAYDSARLASLPEQSSNQDGAVFVAITAREETICHKFQLQSPTPVSTLDHQARHQRQLEATEILFRCLLQYIEARSH